MTTLTAGFLARPGGGRLLVISDVLRDAQRFGFESQEALAARGDQLVAAAAAVAGKCAEVARDDD